MRPPHIQRRVFYVNDGEVLSGFINGDKASDIEERCYRALLKRQIPHAFRFRINPMLGFTQVRMNIIGELEVDFLCQWKGNLYPLMIDGEISHFMAKWQIEADAKKTIKINEALSQIGARPTIRIPFTRLKDQRMTDKTISDIFDNVIPITPPPPKEDVRMKALRGLGPNKREYLMANPKIVAKHLHIEKVSDSEVVEYILNGQLDL